MILCSAPLRSARHVPCPGVPAPPASLAPHASPNHQGIRDQLVLLPLQMLPRPGQADPHPRAPMLWRDPPVPVRRGRARGVWYMNTVPLRCAIAPELRRGLTDHHQQAAARRRPPR
jgi:hypothetical protein